MLGRVAERLKDFFKTRGLYLLSAILAFACTFFLLRLLLKLALHQLLAHQADSPRRQMYARLVAVFSHFVSLLCAIAAMLTVYYLMIYNSLKSFLRFLKDFQPCWSNLFALFLILFEKLQYLL